MQSNSSSSCSLKSPAPDVAPLQTRNGRDDGIFPFGQGYPSTAKNGSIISNSPDRLEMSAKDIGKKGEERNASPLYRTSRTDGSQLHAHSSVPVPPSSNAQKIAHDKREEINLQQSFENNPALKSAKQAPKVVAQSPAMCVSKDNEENARSILVAQVTAELDEKYGWSYNEIRNTNGRHDSSGKIAGLNKEVQLLREQLSISDKKVAQLMQELSASDEKVSQLAQELETHRGNHLDYRTAVDLRNWSDQKESTAREIQDLETKLTKSEQDVARLTKDLAVTRSQKATDQQLAKQVPCKDKDLVQGLAQKERRIRDLGTKLAEYENKCAFLSEQLHQSAITGSAQQQLTDLHKKIQESEAKNNRLAQDLKETQKRYFALEGVEEKLLGSASLFRGAAHLVAPPGIAKLPETVFTCIECYVKGLLCDNCSTCENCKAGGHVCSRWKCSIHKHLGYCPEMPCALVHDEDGWLITKNAIPQW